MECTTMAMGSRPATFHDLDEVPPEKVAELIDGELYVSPRPARVHRRIQIALGGQLFDEFDHDASERTRSHGWWIEHEPEIRLFGNAVVPDCAGWHRERLPGTGDPAFYDVVPDWVCEILSPGSRKHDRERKMPLYAKWGVAYAWLIDPLARLLEVHRLEQQRWKLSASFVGNEPFRAQPFDSREIDPSRWWLPQET